MENLKKSRRVHRRAFRKLCDEIETRTKAEARDPLEIEALLSVILQKFEALRNLDNEIFSLMIQEDKPETEMDTEIDASDELVSRFQFISILVKKTLHDPTDERLESESKKSASSADNPGKRKFKLPTLELIKFDGAVKDYLPFWGQFSKIDADDSLDDSDKFQYLLQATRPGSRARQVVESYPPTAENYTKAVEALKERFGREEMLIEVYVRELISLVICNAQSGFKGNLHKLYDQLTAHLRALETLNVSADKSAILFPIVESCLPEELLRAWKRQQVIPTQQQVDPSIASSINKKQGAMKERMNNLLTFIRSEVENEELIILAKTGFSIDSDKQERIQSEKKGNRKDIPTATGLLSTSKPKACLFCNGAHPSVDCKRALSMTYETKRQIITRKGGCFRCLKLGHLSKACRAVITCDKCKKGHLTVLCYGNQNNAKGGSDGVVDNALTNVSSAKQIALQTITVLLRSEDGTKTKQIRALFDSGSQRSYLSRDAAQEMGYPQLRIEELSHSLFGGHQTSVTKHPVYRARVSSVDGSYLCNFETLQQGVICNFHEPYKSGALKKKMEGLGMNSENDRPIELLIGAEVMAKLMTGRQTYLTGGLLAMQTRLGWTLLGNVGRENGGSVLTLACLAVTEPLTKLWDLDTLGIGDPHAVQTKKERLEEVNEFFNKTLTYRQDGRPMVKLPWKVDHPTLPDNFELALKRTQSKHKRLAEQKRLCDYDQVFSDWLREGIIERCQPTESNRCHYLPHRPVFKMSGTTKVRPVFDASARTSPQLPSLNDCLETGENLIELIPEILLRFRRFAIGATADIKQAFLQIAVAHEDRDFLRFVWFEKNGEIVHFRHTRVVFGVCCSPFLLGATLQAHLNQAAKNCGEGRLQLPSSVIEKLKKSFYVDNLVTSVETVQELLQLKETACTVLEAARFELRGWASSMDVGSDDTSVDENVLGLIWDRCEDTLRIRPINTTEVPPDRVTKRTLLSLAQRLFDPIGFSSPVTLLPKLLLQSTWELKIKWDEVLPDSITTRFIEWLEQLKHVFEIRVPRWTRCVTYKVTWHIFVDASKTAYAAVIFSRATTAEGTMVNLIAARTRIAPLKDITIPRMELLAALIGSRLYHSLKSGEERAVEAHFWTDSTTVLAWIRRKEVWATFVKNRVQEINQLSDPSLWRHIPGDSNPADLPSRGCDAATLARSRWWEGPAWLRKPEAEWPFEDPQWAEEEIGQEKRKTALTCANVRNHKCDWVHNYFSDYEKMVRLIGWIYRFKGNCLKKCEKKYGELSVAELEGAERRLIKLIQVESFSGVDDEKLKRINLIVDEDGILRFRTRLINRDDTYEFRSPAILPNRHVAVTALIRGIHLRHQHVGVQGLLSLVREKFWVLQGRKAVRTVVWACQRCRRFESRRFETREADLPNKRVRDAMPFEITGVDLAGPLYLRGGRKVWICIFTCAVIRAVHLEVVNDMSTEAYLQAFRRFVARRGRPSTVYSDNGTNFVGASNLLNAVNWSKICEFSTIQRIDWRFNPPSAAWWGGWWERLIRLIKQLLRKHLGRASLTLGELTTVLCEIEATINSRPLTYISEDAADLTPLTPAMFLHEIQEVGVPDLDRVEAEDLQRRYRHRVSVREALRKRFRLEYLGLLAQARRRKSGRQIRVGEIVLVEQEGTKRLEWPLARVLELIPGGDGEVRVVKMQTATGQMVRPVLRVFPLETPQEDQEECQLAKEDIPGRVCDDDEPQQTTDQSDSGFEKPHSFNRTTRAGRQVRVPNKLDL